ncbi:hypothetical protein ACXU4B_17645 [Dyella soli]|uniref:hypothetical protein n=1 Tax=Dyella soli TaxID=522319 RepID=UPI0013F3D2DA|nr:hypothetical protein [Dyella soli]
MKFETIMLHGFFASSLLVCLLTLGAMITTSINASRAVASDAPVVTAAKAHV